jgi:hypothetical protein
LAPLLGCSPFGSRKTAARRDPAAGRETLTDLIAPTDRHDSSDQRENPERIEATLKREPTENAEANEPDEPIDRIEPDDPIDKIEPDDPIDKIEPDDPMLRKDSEESGEPDDDRSSGRMRALSQQPPPRD